MKAVELLDLIPDNGVLSIIERNYESDGDLFVLLLIKHLLKQKKTVFVLLYDPFLVFKENLEEIGVNLDEVLGKTLFILDIFGSVHKIEREIEGVYQIKGYIDDIVFVDKFRDVFFYKVSSISSEEIWLFTYLSSSICKLFSNPLMTYKRLLPVKSTVTQVVKSIKVIGVYNVCECPGIERIVYPYSDIIVETLFKDGRKMGIVTKGYEETAFELFGGD